MAFFGREKEKKKLSDTIKSNGMQVVLVYGRVDLTINLKPMDYYESALFYQDYSQEDKVRIYSAFGGIPYYNRFVDTKKSVKENIINLVASPDARLANEVEMYLLSELSKISNGEFEKKSVKVFI